MAAGKISFVKTQGMWGFTALLVSAVCEWFLIILLLIDALLSYLLKKFASFCGLQAPCMLCSRLDVALGGQKPELYRTLLCSNHISEVTSLISCHIHNKVADGGGMCDDCLLSFTRKTIANSKAHRLGLVHGDCSFQCSLKGDLFSGSSGSRPCNCCGKLWTAGQSATSGPCTCCRSITSHCVGKNNCDSELEFPFSDDNNDVAALIHANNEAGSDPKCQCASITSSKFPPSDSNPVEQDKNKAVDVSQASDNGLQSIRDHEGDLMKNTTSEEQFEQTDLVVKDSSHTSLRHKNLSEVDKFSTSVEEIEVPCFIREQLTEEVDKVNDKEELKLSTSQISSPQDSSVSSIIPSGDAYPPEMQTVAANRNVLQKSVSLDSGLESMDGSNVSKIEEASLIDQLKRQIACDKQCMNSLHKELEEERNASAIAANEAMAMITKLQEEKAALRMEALQYLRMMEEQAEHDAIALERADDLLSEKEKVIQDLEAELDFYRLNLVEEPMVETMLEENSHLKEANKTLQNVGLPHITNNINSSCKTMQTQNS
ncbi:probable myosin-binding protein 4 [Prosopis cineraria]|uniref:probable myosin-binding protein 4 n=1 Tax=Prosopis cineraria TaxID=364024 RepID=UPI00240FA411|nr:probable myosin-binding protein 4 [Prosopis cineraria]XP_054805562.1 probable myosin-binding protein 4 [Prosopis cineraria]